ncbi:MAG: hypothetical protein GOV02_00260 [Candidatus Aenigmarchaeota archaeon]|nr:hypothetical protein [Candidatus Aenigmarchaeota archaeon]
MSRLFKLTDFQSLFQNSGNPNNGIRVLSPSTIDVDVLYREREQQGIYDEIMFGDNETNLIYGSSGCGKSVISREVAKSVVRYQGGKFFDGNSVYSHDGDKKIYIYYVPFLSSGPEELPGYLSKKNIEDYGGDIQHVVFIDQLDMHSKEADDLDNIFGVVKKSLDNPKIFGVSVKHIDYNFKNELHFESYKNGEIIGILNNKADKSFQPGVLDPRVIQSCADITEGRFNSNISTGMHLLRSTGNIAERSKSPNATLEHLKEATELKLRSHREEMIDSLPENYKLVLDATNCSIRNNTGKIEMNEVYRRYSDMSGCSKYTEFVNVLMELDKQSLHNGCKIERVNGSLKINSIFMFPEKESGNYNLKNLC